MKALDRLRSLAGGARTSSVGFVSPSPKECQDSFEEEEKERQLTNYLIKKETRPSPCDAKTCTYLEEATDKTDKADGPQEGPDERWVPLGADGLPCAPCLACGGLSFLRSSPASVWRCIRCDGQPAAGSLGEWCAVPSPSYDTSTKGICVRCGEPVTWQGQLEGLRNWLSEV